MLSETCVSLRAYLDCPALDPVALDAGAWQNHLPPGEKGSIPHTKIPLIPFSGLNMYHEMPITSIIVPMKNSFGQNTTVS